MKVPLKLKSCPRPTPIYRTLSTTATIPEGRSQSPTKYIEIDVESNNQEESKHDQSAAEEDPFSNLPTQKLFNMSLKILSII